MRARESDEAQAEAALTPVSLRLPSPMLEQLRERAENIGIGYQALIKVFIAEGLHRADK